MIDLSGLFANIGNGLNQFFQGAVNSPSGTLQQFNPQSGGNYLSNLAQPSKPPQLQIPQPPQGVAPRVNPQQIQQGIQNFAPNTPLATMSGSLAQAGNSLPPNVSPLLPTIIALMESQGGMKQAGANNPFGIMSQGPGGASPANYPDPTTALMGGGPQNQQGFMGTLMNSGNYNPFLQSGNMADFFNKYTPQGGGNPSLAELIMRYNILSKLFPALGQQGGQQATPSGGQ